MASQVDYVLDVLSYQIQFWWEFEHHEDILELEERETGKFAVERAGPVWILRL